MAELTTHTGVFYRFRYRSDDGSGFLIAFLEDNTQILGTCEDGELSPGISYRFYGKWDEHPEHGKRFKFTQFIVVEPHSRHGIIAYLTKYAHGVGSATAAKLYDTFGGEAVKVLRLQPEAASECVGRWLPIAKARAASEALKELAKLEDTKIELTNLFNGRGFPGALVEECCKKWGILAPARIRRDPFSLLVNGMTGAGFARCDRLYEDLGLPPGRIKRQLICMWHIIKSDSSGHTWFNADAVVEEFRRKIGRPEVEEPARDGRKRKKKRGASFVVKFGVRAKWLATQRDDAGVLWIADAERARAEASAAERIIELMFGTVVEPATASVVPAAVSYF
jgi:exodeoxyribonuclease V alpha subunit